MHGFYKANGGCGYVKKPDFLMGNGSHGEVFDPKANLPIKKTLKVRILYVKLNFLLHFLFSFFAVCKFELVRYIGQSLLGRRLAYGLQSDPF